VNGDSTAAYVAIAVVGTLVGYNLYVMLIAFAHRRNCGAPILTAREVRYLAAALLCGVAIVAGCATYAQSLMARLCLILGSATLAGACIAHVWLYRRVFAIRR
jgi:hypothetical protein